ncbi:lysogeny maintenance protein PflM [Metapseudomonas resinovorans]|uniref:lysogeny maintenance protein PflM n=1 Tax=Metapseudomonas resinovorans TaxID=53412 RepID=UPI00138AB719|nr:DUF5447 family protein [Pseudomonas resinovorans]
MDTVECWRCLARAEHCVCSVCWCPCERAKCVLSRSMSCEHGRPARISRAAGRRVCPRASCCGKHRRVRRALKYWRVVYGSGAPTPSVSICEPFGREP